MTREEFLTKYPLPWKFGLTDRSGHGGLFAANGQMMMYLCTDDDWVDNLDPPHADDDDNFSAEELKSRPVLNWDSITPRGEGGELKDGERANLIDFVLARINGDG